jgi:hypothetical protein
MALNLWLLLFRRYDASQLDRIERYYYATNSLLPLLLAMLPILITLESSGVEPIYGPDTLWCGKQSICF